MPENTNTQVAETKPSGLSEMESAVILSITALVETFLEQKGQKELRDSAHYGHSLTEQTKMHEKTLLELGILDTKDKWLKGGVALICITALVLLARFNVNDHGATAIISGLLTAVFVGSNNNLYTLFIKNQGGKEQSSKSENFDT